jgi:hypothetical protein
MRHSARPGEQTPGSFWRAARHRSLTPGAVRVLDDGWQRQPEELSSLVEGVAQLNMRPSPSDDIEQIAMLARRAVSLMCSCT